MKRAGKRVTASDNVGAANLLVNRMNLRPQSLPFAVFTTLRAGKALGTERERFHVRRGTSLDLLRYFPPEHCAMSARVVITIALRARALRTAGFGLSGAASARRLKNRYGSTLEVLSHVQIWYVEKETRELVRIQQAELLESFHKAQSNYR